MSGEIITYHQGQVVYQDGEQSLALPSDLAAKFYPVMQAWVRREIDDRVFQQQHAIALAEAKDRLGIEQVTQFAATTLQYQAQGHQAESDRLMQVINQQARIIEKQTQANVEIARATGDRQVGVVIPWYCFLTAETITVGVMAFGFVTVILLGLIQLAKSPVPTQPSLPSAAGVNRVY